MEALTFLAVLFAYFLPTMLASWRKHPNEAGISVLNLFLGWTVLGWIGALVWAVSNNPEAKLQTKGEEPKRITRDHQVGKWQCPWCFGEIDPGAVVCPHCRRPTGPAV